MRIAYVPKTTLGAACTMLTMIYVAALRRYHKLKSSELVQHLLLASGGKRKSAPNVVHEHS